MTRFKIPPLLFLAFWFGGVACLIAALLTDSFVFMSIALMCAGCLLLSKPREDSSQ